MKNRENLRFWQLITQFNLLMKSAIDGPNCIDPKNCRGDCCSIKIDVPKVLAEEYIKRGYANKGDFIRSDIFTFHLRFNEKTNKCFLFDDKINGCTVHDSGIKPPQCWIYPTGFSNSVNNIMSCKKLSGWKIKNPSEVKKAEELLHNYVFLCKLEARDELKKIDKRITFSDRNDSNTSYSKILDLFKHIKPCELAGVKDEWDHLGLLPADGFSLQMKKFCLIYNSECTFLSNNFFECNNICEVIGKMLYNVIVTSLYKFIKKNGQNPEGEYCLINLFNFISLNSFSKK